MSTPNDKPQEKDVFEDPKLYVVVGKDKFPKLGLETAFVDFPDGSIQSGNNQTSDNDSKTVGGIVCSCNKVRVGRKTSAPECSCVGYSSCSCVGHSSCSCVGHSSGGYSGGGCRCAPVH